LALPRSWNAAAERAATRKPPVLPRKLAPDPVLALKTAPRRPGRQEAGRMREAAIKALRDHGAKGE